MYESLIICFIIFLGSMVQSCTGFGLALVTVPLLSQVIDVKLSIPLALIFSIIICANFSFIMRKNIQWKAISFLSLGCIPGTFIGILALKYTKHDIILLAMGIVVATYCIFRLTGPKLERMVTSPWKTLCYGFTSGTLGSAVGESGPPIVLFAAMQNWNTNQVKATMFTFFGIQVSMSLIGYYFEKMITSELVSLTLNATPGFLLGIVSGVLLYRVIKIKNISFDGIIHSLLLINAIYITIASLSNLLSA